VTLLDILLAIARHDASSEHALRALNDQHRERLIREFHSRSHALRRSPHDVEDLLQIVYERIFRKAHTFRGTSEGEAWNWVKRLSYRCLLTQVTAARRRRKFEVMESLPMHSEDEWDTSDYTSKHSDLNCDEFFDPSKLVETEEWLVRFKRKHPEQARIIVFLIHGLSPKEIAPLIGRSVRATTQYIYECRRLALRYRDHLDL